MDAEKHAKKAGAGKAPAKKSAAEPLTDAGVPEEIKALLEIISKRPPDNSSVPPDAVISIFEDINDAKTKLETYAAHLRALDRKRLNGIGVKTRGFVDAAVSLAALNPEFLPRHLSVGKLNADHSYYVALRALSDAAEQIRELLLNLTIEAADIDYTNALEFYASVREAAKRRVDASESVRNELKPFFKNMGRARPADGAQPTKKQQLRDAKALIEGRRDGKIVIENVSPHTSGGVHKVIDKRFIDGERFKETAEGDI